MSDNPSAKNIDIHTQEGLELLKIKALFYGHYAEQLKVLELIAEIENLRESWPETQEALDIASLEASKKLRW
jgi:hypothetical protein